MLFGITRKEYRILKTKYIDAQEKIIDLERLNKSLKEDLKNANENIQELLYRQKMSEDEISKLNKIICNSMEERNRLNVELLELKNKPKRGRPKKKIEEEK